MLRCRSHCKDKQTGSATLTTARARFARHARTLSLAATARLWGCQLKVPHHARRPVAHQVLARVPHPPALTVIHLLARRSLAPIPGPPIPSSSIPVHVRTHVGKHVQSPAGKHARSHVGKHACTYGLNISVHLSVDMVIHLSVGCSHVGKHACTLVSRHVCTPVGKHVHTYVE